MTDSTGVRRSRDTDSRVSDAILNADKDLINQEKKHLDETTQGGNNGPGISNSSSTATGNFLSKSGDTRLGRMGNEFTILEIIDDTIDVSSTSLNTVPVLILNPEGGVPDDLINIIPGSDVRPLAELYIQNGGSTTITLKEDPLGNILTPGTSNVVLGIGDIVKLYFSQLLSAWVIAWVSSALSASGDFLPIAGGAMLGPIAYDPDLESVDSDGRIDITSSYMFSVGSGAPDDVFFFDGALFDGQQLIYQVTNQTSQLIKNAVLKSIVNIVGNGTDNIITVTIDDTSLLVTGDKVNIKSTTNFDIDNATITVTTGTEFTYDLGSIGSATAETFGIVQRGNIVMPDDQDLLLDSTISSLGVAIASFVFDPSILGTGWRLVSSTVAGGGTGVSFPIRPPVTTGLPTTGNITLNLNQNSGHYFTIGPLSGDIDIDITNPPAANTAQAFRINIIKGATDFTVTFNDTLLVTPIIGGANSTTLLAGDIYDGSVFNIFTMTSTAGSGGAGENQTPWLTNINAAGFSLNNLLSLDVEDSDGNTKLNISGPLGVGARFSFVAGDSVIFTENITDRLTISSTSVKIGADLDFNTFDGIKIDRLLFDKTTGESLTTDQTGITSNANGVLIFNVPDQQQYFWQNNAQTIMQLDRDSTNNDTVLTLETDISNASAIPFFKMFRDDPTPAKDTEITNIEFIGRHAATDGGAAVGNASVYAKIVTEYESVITGREAASVNFFTSFDNGATSELRSFLGLNLENSNEINALVDLNMGDKSILEINTLELEDTTTFGAILFNADGDRDTFISNNVLDEDRIDITVAGAQGVVFGFSTVKSLPSLSLVSSNSAFINVSSNFVAFDPLTEPVDGIIVNGEGLVFFDTSTDPAILKIKKKSSTGVVSVVSLEGAGGGSGANTSLSNLDTTSINENLIAAGSQSLGVTTDPWEVAFITKISEVNSINFSNALQQIVDIGSSLAIDFDSGVVLRTANASPFTFIELEPSGFTNTRVGVGGGQQFQLSILNLGAQRANNTPVINDLLATIQFKGQDNANTDLRVYAGLLASIADPSSTDFDGRLLLQVANSNTGTALPDTILTMEALNGNFLMGFFGETPVVQQPVSTGSFNDRLAALEAGLSNLGLFE